MRTRLARKPTEVFPPADFIREEMEARGWTLNDIADRMECLRRRAKGVLAGDVPITRQVSECLGKAFGTSPGYWLTLQYNYDMWLLESRAGRQKP
jgi:HTH-type transcriptional regulator/antitoxin HigA